MQTVQTIISEVGVDMSRSNTEKQFASWLGLCPNRISGGKILKSGTRQVVNRAATARQACRRLPIPRSQDGGLSLRAACQPSGPGG